jgi:hypothetical protein
MKISRLPNEVSKFMPKKFYGIDPRHVCYKNFTDVHEFM